MELRNLLSRDYKNNLQRVKASRYHSGNKAGRLLARQIKSQNAKKKITVWGCKNLVIRENPADIADTFADYYTELYDLQSDPSIPQPTFAVIYSFLHCANLPQLSNLQFKSISYPFTPQEIQKMIAQLPLRKASGLDGYTNEFYKFLSQKLIDPLSSVFNLAAVRGPFPDEMLKGVITTIPKPGKDPTVVGNYRPISLLNTVLKIFSKTL